MIKSYTFGIIVFLLSNSIVSYARKDIEERDVVLKMYSNMYYETETRLPDRVYPGPFIRSGGSYNYSSTNYRVGNLSLSVEFIDGGVFSKEIEIMPIEYSRSNDFVDLSSIFESGIREKISTFSFVRYQATHYFGNDWTVTPYLALSTKLYYDFIGFYADYGQLGENRSTVQNVGVQFDIIPGIYYSINDKVAVNFSIPFGAYNVWMNRVLVPESWMSPVNQKIYYLNHKLFSTIYHFRIGLQYFI